MRLVCPNCDAEYEVNPAVIPNSGRDVQCSNCGTSWFQPSPAAEEAAAEEAALFDPPPALPQEPAAAVPAVKPRGLDESVLAVLREEAEREAAARRAEASQPIETQPDLGLTAAPAAAIASPAAQRIARLKGVEGEQSLAKRPQTRREMLPTIEEINSTLRATSERRTGEPVAVAESLPVRHDAANGFRSGFVLVLVIAALGVFAYVMAPRIGQQIPGLAPGMASYVEAVDGARLWLDAMMQQAISALRGISGDQATLPAEGTLPRLT